MRQLLPIFAQMALLFSAFPALAAPLNLSQLLKNGAIRVESGTGKVLLEQRGEELFIPASTIKVATAFCALEELGREFRFITEFFEDGRGSLFIKGSGDPLLISEELKAIASKIAPKLPRIESIVIDTSYFAQDIELDGYSRSLNPYDARNAAFVGNFSSAYITHRRDGSVSSAEPQTPLTPLAQAAGKRLASGKTERVNLGANWRIGAQYGGELLVAFLRESGARGAMRISVGSVPPAARSILRHQSSQSLSAIVRGLLEYSTNFTANQIFLVLGAHRFGAPATAAKAQRALTECLQARAGWTGFHVEEGAGLSRRNQVSARLMNQLLERFQRYSDLLPVEEGFRAKTGTLRGVNTLAGYFALTATEQARFAILINSEVPHRYKFDVAKAVRRYLLEQ